MAERRNHAEELSRYWDALTAGETSADPGSLDPEEAAFVLTMVAHARRAQLPAGARERAKAASLRQFALTHAHRVNGETAMQLGTLSAPAPLVPPRPFVVHPARPQWWERGASIIGVAALIVAMVGGIFFTYHSSHDNQLPAVIASPTANPVATPIATPTAAGPALPPDAKVGGLSLADWTIRAVQWNISFPMAINPWSDTTGERCGYGQSGPVFFLGLPAAELDPSAPLAITRSCTVPAGVALFAPVVFNECDNVSPAPFFGADEAAQRACAAANIDHGLSQILAAGGVTVDGTTIDLAPYRVSTPQFTLILPAGNVDNAPAGAAAAVSDGFQLLIAPLAPGTHVITITLPHQGQTSSVTYNLTVAPPPSAAPAATPAA